MIKALIIDDEASAANVLQLMIERHVPEIKDLRIATKLGEAHSLIDQFQPQLVFLDIVMPEKNGFEFLGEVKNIKFEIIFTTAFNEYAIRAIRFSALDYILKPINAEELKAAVCRFIQKRSQQLQTEGLLNNLMANLAKKNEAVYKLAIPTVSGTVFFSHSEIIRLEGESNYSNFYLTQNRRYVSAKTLKDYEDILTKSTFIRIHKSHLVNRSFIDGFYNDGSVLLKDKTILPVSRLRKQEVARILKGE